MKRVTLLLLFLAATLGWTRVDGASILTVAPGGGGDFADLQAAIDAAQPGDVIRVEGGSYPPITIDKDLTLVGAPAPTILGGSTTEPGDPGHLSPMIRLAGPGSGRVVLHGIRAAGDADASLYQTTSAAIAGGGFDALHLYRSEIQAARWIQYANDLGISLHGPRAGAPAIDVELPLVVVSRSVLAACDSVGSDTVEINCELNPLDGPPGLLAADPPGSSASVVLLDTTVQGGAGSTVCIWQELVFNGPAGCPCFDWQGYGGPGVRASNLFVANCDLRGGQGGIATCGDHYVVYPWGFQPDGPPHEGESFVELDTLFDAPNPLVLGARFTLDWSTSGINNLLIVGRQPTTPIFVPGAGLLMVDPATVINLLVLPNGLQSVTAAVPPSRAALGEELTMQVLDPTSGLTRPVVDAHRGDEYDVLTFAANGLPLMIPDNDPIGLQSQISVSGVPGTLHDVDVSVRIMHAMTPDLDVLLIHPDGTSVRLETAGGHYLEQHYPDIDTTYDTFTSPAESLEALVAKPGAGIWRLKVVDTDTPGFMGVLEAWSLELTMRKP